MTVTEKTAVKPTFHKKLWNGTVEIFYFGLNNDIQWADLKNFEHTETPAYKALEEIIREQGIKNVYKPTMHASAILTTPPQFSRSKYLYDKSHYFWNGGIKADGMERIPSGSAFAMLGGDCPVAVIQDSTTGEVCAAHFCRENSVTPPYIAEEMLKTFPINFFGKRVLKTFIGCSIAPRHFHHKWNDEKYGAKNREMTERLVINFGRHIIHGPLKNGCIDLKALWFAQLRNAVDPLNIDTDNVDTYGDCWTAFTGEDCDPTNVPYYGSHRRSGKDSRNLILVVNRA